MLKKLTFTLVTILILLGLTEAALRLFWNEPHKTPDREDFVKFHPHPNPEIAFTLPPNYYNWAAKIWTNSWGFRGKEIGEKKPGQYRLLAIGDSNMFGSYVTHNQTIMAVFKSRMNLSNHTKYDKFIFANLCVPGHNLTQYRAVLEEYGDKVSPDFIVCGISVFNDFNGIFQIYHDLGFIRRE
ncbi:MAG: hypothetical protein JW737_05410, partial [Acidobacteria bacterium]|nr:hypothetical protein [Acidobacteriota bacterium]